MTASDPIEEAARAEAGVWLADGEARLDRARVGAAAEAVGRVERMGDGIALVSGLPDIRLMELLDMGEGRRAFALTLDTGRIGAVMMDDGAGIAAGSPVRGTGQVVTVPVGPGLLGRVVDPLGRPLDGGGAVKATETLPVERPAPAIMDRDLVTEPVETGLLVVDALFALGRGQRELIVGDRATGKTAVAVDTIINQAHSDMICVYVAVGQRASAVRRVIDAVKRFGAPERTVFVVAGAGAPAGLQWMAPFAGMTIAEAVRDAGGHALIVIDDLTRHAATHRELALLTHEPPGREAYPGDVFYLHSRLLERAAKLSPELGGGSLTALPIAETDAGNLSAYIPTNLISITDGQIVLDRGLFAADQRPAVDVGLSVSRVGGKTQTAALRGAVGRLRLDYAQFLELEMFTRFGRMTDTRVRDRIRRGEAIRAWLRQPRYAALRPIDEIAVLVGLSEGVFDGLSKDQVETVRPRLAAHLDAHAPGAARVVAAGGKLDDAARAELVAALKELTGHLPALAATGTNG
ncbi:F0F1 ATP synthase subunit alpha [Tistrella mobilis]|uniref:ATP synthase subunit alpha n=1 Tax=Tistrella mobilis (strain KA081020-065) TaxID=1110502 RepID=I3TL57_TISMK|nr:F0F1 ATP synthase subunit alpha [Tistrella mobilis]AFK53495.1 F0F1 ATP synthase subunit alpha [Tistrella mobilis KA081020-065]